MLALRRMIMAAITYELKHVCKQSGARYGILQDVYKRQASLSLNLNFLNRNLVVSKFSLTRSLYILLKFLS